MPTPGCNNKTASSILNSLSSATQEPSGFRPSDSASSADATGTGTPTPISNSTGAPAGSGFPPSPYEYKQPSLIVPNPPLTTGESSSLSNSTKSLFPSFAVNSTTQAASDQLRGSGSPILYPYKPSFPAGTAIGPTAAPTGSYPSPSGSPSKTGVGPLGTGESSSVIPGPFRNSSTTGPSGTAPAGTGVSIATALPSLDDAYAYYYLTSNTGTGQISPASTPDASTNTTVTRVVRTIVSSTYTYTATLNDSLATSTGTVGPYSTGTPNPTATANPASSGLGPVEPPYPYSTPPQPPASSVTGTVIYTSVEPAGSVTSLLGTAPSAGTSINNRVDPIGSATSLVGTGPSAGTGIYSSSELVASITSLVGTGADATASGISNVTDSIPASTSTAPYPYYEDFNSSGTAVNPAGVPSGTNPVGPPAGSTTATESSSSTTGAPTTFATSIRPSLTSTAVTVSNQYRYGVGTYYVSQAAAPAGRSQLIWCRISLRTHPTPRPTATMPKINGDHRAKDSSGIGRRTGPLAME